MKQVMDYRYLGKSIPGRRNSKRKGPEVEICLTFGRNSRRNQYGWSRIRERKSSR